MKMKKFCGSFARSLHVAGGEGGNISVVFSTTSQDASNARLLLLFTVFFFSFLFFLLVVKPLPSFYSVFFVLFSLVMKGFLL